MNTKITKEGFHIIEGDTHVGKWIEDSGKLDHDEFLIPLASSGLKLGDVCIDAGALYGDHTIAYAKAVGHEGTVIAIESNPLAFSCLKENMKKAEGRVLCVNAALGQAHGGKAMHEIHEGNIGMSTVTEDEKKGVEIPTVSIDGLMKDADLTKLAFIKIDCEGWEFNILKGARGVLKFLRPVLLIEINSFALAQQGTSDRDIYDLLLECGYSWKITQPECTGSSPQFDILCFPNKVLVQRDIELGSAG